MNHLFLAYKSADQRKRLYWMYSAAYSNMATVKAFKLHNYLAFCKGASIWNHMWPSPPIISQMLKYIFFQVEKNIWWKISIREKCYFLKYILKLYIILAVLCHHPIRISCFFKNKFSIWKNGMFVNLFLIFN